MSNPSVSFSADEAVSILNTLGALVGAVYPKTAGDIAALTGAATLINDTLVPAIQHFGQTVISVADQASLAAASALERADVGAPPSKFN